MKRRLCLVLFLLMLVTCVTASGEAADWNYDANYGILRGYNGAGGDVVVPGELDGFTVDVIGVSVFRGETITSLTLPETVLELRSNAISTCDNLTPRFPAPKPCGHQPHELLQLHGADGSYHSRRRALYRRRFIQILRIAAQDYL